MLIGTGIPNPHQKSIRVGTAVPTSDSFCMDRLGLWLYCSNNSCSYSYLFIYFVYLGGEPHHSFLCLGTISSVYVSLCVCFHFILFSLCMFLSILGFGDFFFLVLCGMDFFECVCPSFDLFYYFHHLLSWSFIFIFSSPSVPLLSPHLFFFSLFYVTCSLSIYFSYIFALKRPPKVALPSYSLPGLPWNETIFSLCSEVCGSNTLPFAHLVGWEPLCP